MGFYEYIGQFLRHYVAKGREIASLIPCRVALLSLVHVDVEDTPEVIAQFGRGLLCPLRLE